MKGLLVVLALAAAPAAAIDCSAPDKVADFKRSSDVDFKACIDNDGAVITPEVKADSATFNSVSYSFPEADGTNGQVLATDAAGNLDWTDKGVGGGANLGDDQTFTGTNEFTSTMTVAPSGFAVGFWHTVASASLKGSTSVQFNGLDPAKMYKVIYNLSPSIDTEISVHFSTASCFSCYSGLASNYQIRNDYRPSSSDARFVESAGSSALGYRIFRTGRQLEAGESVFGEMTLAPNPSNHQDVQAYGKNRYFDSGAIFVETATSAFYQPTEGAFQGIRFESITGVATMTGTIFVLALQ